MTLRIGSNIKKLRAAKGVTQEKLAEYIGVSCQAISKWESENGYPDIELIPALAGYFNITADELLGIDTAKSKEIISGYMKSFFELTDDAPAQLALMREAAVKFPNNFLLLQSLMYALIFNIDIHLNPEVAKSMMTKSTVLDETANKELLREAVMIAERILEDCLDDSIRHSAIQILCYYYPLINKKENAVLLADAMPPLYISRDFLLEEIFTGEEKLLQIQKNICRLTDCLCNNLLSIADPDCQQQNDIATHEKIHLIDIANKIYRLIFENGDFNIYNCRLAYSFRLMAALHLLEDQPDDALNCLEKAAEYAAAADTVPESASFTSLAVNRLKEDSALPKGTQMLNYLFHQRTTADRIVLKIEKTEATQSAILLKKLQQSRYDQIRATEQFEHMIYKLRQYA